MTTGSRIRDLSERTITEMRQGTSRPRVSGRENGRRVRLEFKRVLVTLSHRLNDATGECRALQLLLTLARSNTRNRATRHSRVSRCGATRRVAKEGENGRQSANVCVPRRGGLVPRVQDASRPAATQIAAEAKPRGEMGLMPRAVSAARFALSVVLGPVPLIFGLA